jgi:hypothetical protein
MAVFENPKKAIQVDFPIEKVKLSVQNIDLRNDQYKLSNANEVFNQYTYESLQFIRFGVFIDIALKKLGEDKTEITVEIRRKVGTFKQSHEITNADKHITNVYECIAFLTTKSQGEIEKYKTNLSINKVSSSKNQALAKKKSLGEIIFIAFCVLVVILITVNAFIEEPEKEPVIKTAMQLKEEHLARVFSSWDGSSSTVVDLVKATLNDPESFEHLNTNYIQTGSDEEHREYLVTMEFTAKNGFGGRLRKWVTVILDKDGNYVSTIKWFE